MIAVNAEFVRQVGPIKWAWRTTCRQFAKRVLKRGVSIGLPTGARMQIPANSRHGSEVYVTNCDVDWGSEELFANMADPAKDFLDIGANIGYYSLYLSPLVRKVYSFEPDGRNFDALINNISQLGNIKHIPNAVSDRHGPVNIDISGDSSLSSIVANSGNGTVPVDAITIDGFYTGYPDAELRLVKIDIEGHDVAALEGGRDTIIRDQPLILIEFGGGDTNPSAINNPDRLIAFCEKNNYSIFAFTKYSDGKYATRLVAITREDFSTLRLKMLFLTPGRLRSKFLERVADGRS